MNTIQRNREQEMRLKYFKCPYTLSANEELGRQRGSEVKEDVQNADLRVRELCGT